MKNTVTGNNTIIPKKEEEVTERDGLYYRAGYKMGYEIGFNRGVIIAAIVGGLFSVVVILQSLL